MNDSAIGQAFSDQNRKRQTVNIFRWHNC